MVTVWLLFIASRDRSAKARATSRQLGTNCEREISPLALIINYSIYTIGSIQCRCARLRPRGTKSDFALSDRQGMSGELSELSRFWVPDGELSNMFGRFRYEFNCANICKPFLTASFVEGQSELSPFTASELVRV